MCDNAIKSIGNTVREATGKIADFVRPVDPLGAAVSDRVDEQTKHWDDTGTTKYIGAAAAAYFTGGASLAAQGTGTAAAGAGGATVAGAGATTAAGAATSYGAATSAIITGAKTVAAVQTLNNVINPPSKPVVPTAGPVLGNYGGAVAGTSSLPTQIAPPAAAKPAPGDGGGSVVVAVQAESKMTPLALVAAAAAGYALLKG